MTRLQRAAVLLAAALTGCAAGPRAPRPTQDPTRAPRQVAAPDEREQLAALEAELDALLAPTETPSPGPIAAGQPTAEVCEAACARVAAICELSARICVIAERNDRDPELDAGCADASARCGGARSRVAPLCECPAR